MSVFSKFYNEPILSSGSRSAVDQPRRATTGRRAGRASRDAPPRARAGHHLPVLPGASAGARASGAGAAAAASDGANPTVQAAGAPPHPRARHPAAVAGTGQGARRPPHRPPTATPPPTLSSPPPPSTATAPRSAPGPAVRNQLYSQL